MKRWWAGQRGEVTSAEIDLRVGGTWRYVDAYYEMRDILGAYYMAGGTEAPK